MFKSLATIVIATAAFSSNAASADTPDAAALTKQVTQFVREQASRYPGAAHITVDPLNLDNLSACQQSTLFLPAGQLLRPRLSVGIRCAAPQPWVRYAQVSLSIDGAYYIAARSLKPGATLTLDDMTTRKGDLLRLPNGVIFDADRLVGSITTQRINAGSPIKARALRSPDSIQRGQMVRLEARGTGFVATSEGKAMQNADPGRSIQVRTHSGQTVSGTVLNSYTVLVLM